MGDNRNGPEGRSRRETGAGRPFRVDQAGEGGIRCECNRWTWREVIAGVGAALTVVERWCPKCQERKLVVMRRSILVAVVPLMGRDVQSIETALEGAGLPPAQVTEVVAVVQIVRGG